MKFPCELLAEPYIAQLRVETAKNLHEEGYTQMDIAKLLQVSQPVISGYLKKGRNQAKLPQLLLSSARDVAFEVTKIFKDQGQEGTEQAINIGCRECKILRQSGPTCIYHKSITNHLEPNCTACLTGTPLLQLQIDKQGVLKELSSLFDFLANSKSIDKIIPEIGMQIVCSTRDPETMSDIAAFPGRIIKRKNRIPLAETPIFGGSETTSQLLLDIRKINPIIRCITAIKTSTWLSNRLKMLNYQYLVIEKLEEDMSKQINGIDQISNMSIIVGKNSVGYESISYVCTSNTKEMVELLSDILI